MQFVISKRNKLLKRFISEPSDFDYHELVKLLRYFGFYEVKTGKTSGSRVRFENHDGMPIMLHRPHSRGIVKNYQLKQIKEILEL